MTATQRSPGLPSGLPVHRATALGRPVRAVWPVLAAAAVLGVGLCWAASSRPGVAVPSYLGALGGAVGCFAVATANVRTAARASPGLAMVAALFSYLATVVLATLALLAASPRVVDGPAVAGGLVTATVVWTTGVVRAAWVRDSEHSGPVTLS